MSTYKISNNIKKIPSYNLPDIKIEEVPGKTSPRITEQQIRIRSPKIKSFTHTVSDGTGVRYFSGFGFHPRTVSIKASKLDNNEYAVFYDGVMGDDNLSSGFYVRPDASNNSITRTIIDSTTAFILRDEGNNITGGEYPVYGSDGVYIDITSLAFDVLLIITAYE